MEELADLGFKIRLMLPQWTQDLAQADQVFNQYKMKWEASTQVSEPAQTIYGFKRSGASIAGPGNPSIGGGFTGFATGGIGPSGTPFGRSLVGEGISPLAVALEQERRQRVIQQQGMVNISGQGPRGPGFSNISAGGMGMPNQEFSIVGDALAGVVGEQASFGDEAARKNAANKLGPQGKMGLRNIIYGTIYGLVADVVAQGIGAASQYSAGMSLTGSNQGAQGRLMTQLPRQILGAVPIIGGALSGLAGAAGLDQIEAQLNLADAQDMGTSMRSSSGYATRQSGIQSSRYQAGAGRFSQARSDIESQKVATQQARAQVSRDLMAQWDKEHPDARSSSWYTLGGRGYTPSLLGASSVDLAQADRERVDARNAYAKTVAADTSKAMQVTKDASANQDREEQYQISSAKNEVQRYNPANRYTPYAAMGDYEQNQFGYDVSHLGPKANRNDWQLTIAQGQMASNRLGSAQRDVAEQVAFGGVRQYNPYTESTLSFTDRSKETSIDAYNSLQKAIEDLNATIQQLQRAHP